MYHHLDALDGPHALGGLAGKHHAIRALHFGVWGSNLDWPSGKHHAIQALHLVVELSVRG